MNPNAIGDWMKFEGSKNVWARDTTIGLEMIIISSVILTSIRDVTTRLPPGTKSKVTLMSKIDSITVFIGKS